MPRTKLSAQQDARNDFINLLRQNGYALYGGITCVAAPAHIDRSTLSRRMKDVDKFNISELRSLRTALKIPREDMLKKLEALL